MSSTVMMLVVFLAMGGYYAYFYWNRAKKIKEAGGAQAYANDIYRKQFNLNPGETVEHYFTGQFYLGPLRPDSSPSTVDNVVAGLTGSSYRGATMAFVLTNQDRLAMAVEWGDKTKVADKLAAYKGENLGMDPYKVFGAPKPRILTGEQAYPNHPKYPKPSDAPERHSMTGKLERFVLLEIQSPGHAPDTVWIDPLGAKALTAWSAITSAPVQA